MEKYFEINDSGCNIKCKLYSSQTDGIENLVVFCHGFGGHKDNSAAAKYASRLLSKHKGTAVLTFDWPCHGDDVRKKLTLDDCGTYLGLVVKYADSQLGCRNLCTYDTSFGGYLVLKYIGEHGNPFSKVALRCPAVNMYDVLTKNIIRPDELAALSKGREVLVGFDRKIKVSPAFLSQLQAADITKYHYTDVAKDILIMHGTEDEIVPFEAVRAFAEKNQIDFIPVEGADHRFIDPRKMDEAIAYTMLFLDF